MSHFHLINRYVGLSLTAGLPIPGVLQGRRLLSVSRSKEFNQDCSGERQLELAGQESKSDVEYAPIAEDLNGCTSPQAANHAQQTESANVTATLICVNVCVFLVQVMAHQGGRFSLASLCDNITPLTLGGQWWRLLTSLFIHKTWVHLTENMLELLLFGTCLERVLGHLVFLLLYLATGLAGGVVVLALIPGTDAFGASLATLGLAGGIIGLFGSRLSTLSNRAKWKLGMLVVFATISVLAEVSSLRSWNPGHVAVLPIGICLGIFFETRIGSTEKRRFAVFLYMGLLLLVASFCIRSLNEFELPVYAAERAFDAGDEGEALRNVETGLRMRPQDVWANQVASKIFYKAAEYRNAEKSLAIVLRADGEDEESLFLSGLVFLQTDQCARARAVGEHLAKHHSLRGENFSATLISAPCTELLP